MLDHLDQGGVVHGKDRPAAVVHRRLETEAPIRAERALDLNHPFRRLVAGDLAAGADLHQAGVAEVRIGADDGRGVRRRAGHGP
jgi:hypothetical protein